MRMHLTLVVSLILSSALSAQSVKLAGPPLVARHAHVGDGALIGFTVGGFAGTFIGLADRKRLCPAKDWVCGGPGAPVISMLAGLTIGGIVGGATGALVGAFVKTTGNETQVGLSVPM